MLGRFAFIMGLRMMATLIGWWIYLLTNDPFAIGLVGLSEVVPALSLALYAGHVIDQSEKKKIIVKRSYSLFFGSQLSWFLFQVNLLTTHLSNHWIAICIYSVIFCTGIFRAFTGPVFSAMIAYIVPSHDLQNATTWSQGTWLSASVTGHAVGGFLIAIVGITGTLITIMLFNNIAFFFLIRLKQKPASNVKGVVRTWESVKEGLRFVYKTKELLGRIITGSFCSFIWRCCCINSNLCKRYFKSWLRRIWIF